MVSIGASARTPLACLTLVMCLFVGRPAHAEDSDPWWGRDKALHFGASATIAAGAYGVGTQVFDRRAPALLLGGGIALGVGAAKEGADALGLGTPSFKDFTWDVAGTAFGLALALGVDWLLSSIAAGESRFPAF